MCYKTLILHRQWRSFCSGDKAAILRKKRDMQKLGIASLHAILFMMLSSLAAHAEEEFPKYEFFGGYTYHSLMQGGHRMGWHFSGTRNFHRYFGVSMDIAGLRNSNLEDVSDILLLKTDSRRYLFLAGPRLRNPNFDRIIPSLHFLVGAAHTSKAYTLSTLDAQLQVSDSETRNAFAFEIGGSFDYRIKGPLLLRIVQANYVRVKSKPGTWDEAGSVSFGLVLHQGKGK
jgi:hypothetical protein